MATFATRTFGGTVVDNSYVASQKFNDWLEAAREQEKLGWDVEVTLDKARRVVVSPNLQGQKTARATVTGLAAHQLGREKEMRLNFVATNDGRLISAETLPDGRWQVQIRIARGAEEARWMESLS